MINKKLLAIILIASVLTTLAMNLVLGKQTRPGTNYKYLDSPKAYIDYNKDDSPGQYKNIDGEVVVVVKRKEE